jgi:hypothetical protein
VTNRKLCPAPILGRPVLGHRQALERAGLPHSPGLVAVRKLSKKSGYVAMQHLLESRRLLTAMFTCNDTMVFGATLALCRRARRLFAGWFRRPGQRQPCDPTFDRPAPAGPRAGSKRRTDDAPVARRQQAGQRRGRTPPRGPRALRPPRPRAPLRLPPSRCPSIDSFAPGF